MSELVIYRSDAGTVEVRLRQEQLSQLFGRDRTVIGRHLRNVFAEASSLEKAMCRICTLLVRTSRSASRNGR